MQPILKPRILVLGGSGFIGKNLCRELVKSGATVTCFSIDDPFNDDFLLSMRDKVNWICADFSDSLLLNKALNNTDIVFHLICTTIPATSNSDLKYDLISNVIPTLDLLHLMKQCNVKQIIFVSSGGTIYGKTKFTPISENNINKPICGYGIHKLAIEKYIHLYHHLYGFNYKILRLSNPYGFNQISNRPQGVIGNFIYRALHDETIEIWGDGNVIRDYIFIDDAINAFLSAFQFETKSRIFNIGSGEGHSLIDIINIIEDALNKKLKVKFFPKRSVDLPYNILDIRRAKNELSWEPKIDLITGIKLIAEYCHKHFLN